MKKDYKFAVLGNSVQNFISNMPFGLPSSKLSFKTEKGEITVELCDYSNEYTSYAYFQYFDGLILYIEGISASNIGGSDNNLNIEKIISSVKSNNPNIKLVICGFDQELQTSMLGLELYKDLGLYTDIKDCNYLKPVLKLLKMYDILPIDSQKISIKLHDIEIFEAESPFITITHKINKNITTFLLD